MEYAFLLWPHANTRYQASLQKLALAELHCTLHACGVTGEIAWRDLGGAPWLVVSCSSLSPSALRLIAANSSIYMSAALEDGMLRPISPPSWEYLPSDMAEVLKYKGKTNASFTGLMLNCALFASAFALSLEPLTVMDPMCGKATSLFCALARGWNGVGVEMNGKDILEAGSYLSRYLQLHRIKHKATQGSMTLPGGKGAPFAAWELADTPKHYGEGDTRTVKLIQGDTLHCSHLQKPETVHLLVADLPYGVQHAPRQGHSIESIVSLLKKALPGWRRVMKPGGAIALSFNTYTLKKTELHKVMTDSGFTILSQAPYNDFEHWVEQAVQRDLAVAVKE